MPSPLFPFLRIRRLISTNLVETRALRTFFFVFITDHYGRGLNFQRQEGDGKSCPPAQNKSALARNPPFLGRILFITPEYILFFCFVSHLWKGITPLFYFRLFRSSLLSLHCLLCLLHALQNSISVSWFCESLYRY